MMSDLTKDDLQLLDDLLREKCARYKLQLEISPTTGKPQAPSPDSVAWVQRFTARCEGIRQKLKQI